MSLLKNKYQPLTTTIYFLETELKSAVKTFLEWQEPLAINHERTLETDMLIGDFAHNLIKLLPISTIEIRKYLFQATHGDWVAFVDNSILGTDGSAPSVLSDILNCRMLRMTCSDNGNIFEYKNPIAKNELDKLRTISVTKESGWGFHTYGELLPFEKPEYYKAKKIKDRLNKEILEEYFLNFNIQLFNETFYNNSGDVSAILIRKEGPLYKNAKQLTLEQAQNYFTT